MSKFMPRAVEHLGWKGKKCWGWNKHSNQPGARITEVKEFDSAHTNSINEIRQFPLQFKTILGREP